MTLNKNLVSRLDTGFAKMHSERFSSKSAKNINPRQDFHFFLQGRVVLSNIL
jgi:hypothetical protein